MNSPKLKEQYNELVNKELNHPKNFRFRQPRNLPKKYRKELEKNILEGGKDEGDAGKFLSKVIVAEWRENYNRQDGNYNKLIENIYKELIDGLKVMGIPLETEIFAGEFPTGIFNAKAEPVNGGALLLINTGAIDLIYRIAKLQALYLPQLGSRKLKFWPKKQYTDKKITSMFADCLQFYLLNENVATASHIPLVGGFRIFAFINFIRNCERFLIGHELGHIINGDLRSSAKNHEQEFAADLFSAKILLSLIVTSDDFPEDRDGKEMRFMKVANAASAPLFFFALDKVVTDAENHISTDPNFSNSHPAPEKRKDRWIKELKELNLGEPLEKSLIENIETNYEWVLYFGKHALNYINFDYIKKEKEKWII